MDPVWTVKIIRPDMVDETHEVEVEMWGELAADRTILQKRVERFPLGNFAAVDTAGKIIGFVNSVAIHPRDISTWKDATGDGEYITCDAYGEMGFGVNVAVRKAYAGKKVGNKLIGHVVNLAFACGRSYFRFGSRMLGYKDWHQVFTPDDYAKLLSNGDGGPLYFRDGGSGILRRGPDRDSLKGHRVNPRAWPVWDGDAGSLEALDEGMRFFLRVMPDGLGPPRIFKVQKDYFTDPDSHNFGVIMGWDRSDLS
jgi:hypothetical protein